MAFALDHSSMPHEKGFFSKRVFFAFLLLVAMARCGTCSRLVSVADLHGDFERAKLILIAAGLIDASTLSWIGGDTTLIQTGDIVDRGTAAKQIYELYFRLSEEASKAGGSVINVLGNHELMNLKGDLRYVKQADYLEFGGTEARAEAWGRDGWLGAKVRKFPPVALRGKVIFVHAGVMPKLLDDRGIDGLNADMAAVLSTLVAKVGKGASLHGKADSTSTVISQDRKADLFGKMGPVWTRYYSKNKGSKACSVAKEVLEMTGAVRMVMGHTIQDDHRVHSACGGQLVFADTAISSAYDGEMNFLEHDGEGGVEVVYPSLKVRQRLDKPVPSDDYDDDDDDDDHDDEDDDNDDEEL
eukprot:TRINITY_DN20779_c1_g1_i1.p1 TRINITY_DN20779_c1_g1~~TRINITY_DN20779_c1_g1_i1.p1  ORF type:complete len:374 (-),score=61.09 TRINITY_DN20779_c1_g1_i1:501-1568(-)